MLVPFVIGAQCLAPDPRWSVAEQKNIHKTLLDEWRRFGLLVHDGDELLRSSLHQAVGRLPPYLATLWQEALIRAPTASIACHWSGEVRNQAAELASIAEHAQLAVVDDAVAEVEFHISEEESSTHLENYGGLEVCRFFGFNNSDTLSAAHTLAGSSIERDRKVADVWKERFMALAKAPIKDVCIVDKFVMERHFKSSQSQLSGLERFLRNLDADATGKRYVRVVTSFTEDLRKKGIAMEDVKTEIRRCLTRLSKRNVRRISIVMVPPSTFSRVSHGRFVRFGEHIWEMDLGLAVLEGATVAARSQATFKSCLCVNGYRESEDELTSHPKAERAEVP